MANISTRVLGEEDWQVYQKVRFEALRESPDAFVATYDEEAAYDEDLWRERMRRARRFVVERDGQLQGVASLGAHDGDDRVGELFGLWIAPEVRRTRVARHLVGAVAREASRNGSERLYFWVGSDNGPAVALASAMGFRPAVERRSTHVKSHVNGEEEIAMVLPLYGYEPEQG